MNHDYLIYFRYLYSTGTYLKVCLVEGKKSGLILGELREMKDKELIMQLCALDSSIGHGRSVSYFQRNLKKELQENLQNRASSVMEARNQRKTYCLIWFEL